MSTPLARSICLIHPERPASARCPTCGTFFCAECITEHDGRLTCARCLAAERSSLVQARGRGRRFVIVPALQIAIGLALSWLVFQGLAELLLSVPADFHDGVIWK